MSQHLIANRILFLLPHTNPIMSSPMPQPPFPWIPPLLSPFLGASLSPTDDHNGKPWGGATSRFPTPPPHRLSRQAPTDFCVARRVPCLLYFIPCCYRLRPFSHPDGREPRRMERGRLRRRRIFVLALWHEDLGPPVERIDGTFAFHDPPYYFNPEGSNTLHPPSA